MFTTHILNIDTEQEQRHILHNLLDDVLNNPEEYKTKGTRHVLVRGLFEVVDKNDGSEVVINHYDVDLTANKPDDVGYAVYYLEQNVVKPGEIELRLNNKIIPSHLKDKFIDDILPNEIKENPYLSVAAGAGLLNQFGLPDFITEGDNFLGNYFCISLRNSPNISLALN